MNIQRIKGCIQLAPMSKNGGKEKKDEKKKAGSGCEEKQSLT